MMVLNMKFVNIYIYIYIKIVDVKVYYLFFMISKNITLR